MYACKLPANLTDAEYAVVDRFTPLVLEEYHEDFRATKAVTAANR